MSSPRLSWFSMYPEKPVASSGTVYVNAALTHVLYEDEGMLNRLFSIWYVFASVNVLVSRNVSLLESRPLTSSDRVYSPGGGTS